MLSIRFTYVKDLPQKASPEAEKSCLNHLIICGYQYDNKSGEWSRGRLKLDEWRVTKSIILHLRENFPFITEKGVFAAEIIAKAKHIPQITVTSLFVDRCKSAFGTDRRVAGKAIFVLWCEETGTDMEDDFELFLKRKSLMVNKLYDRLSMVCRWLGRKRINGSVKRNVFVFGEEPLAPVFHAARRPDLAESLHACWPSSLIRPDG